MKTNTDTNAQVKPAVKLDPPIKAEVKIDDSIIDKLAAMDLSELCPDLNFNASPNPSNDGIITVNRGEKTRYPVKDEPHFLSEAQNRIVDRRGHKTAFSNGGKSSWREELVTFGLSDTELYTRNRVYIRFVRNGALFSGCPVLTNIYATVRNVKTGVGEFVSFGVLLLKTDKRTGRKDSIFYQLSLAEEKNLKSMLGFDTNPVLYYNIVRHLEQMGFTINCPVRDINIPSQKLEDGRVLTFKARLADPYFQEFLHLKLEASDVTKPYKVIADLRPSRPDRHIDQYHTQNEVYGIRHNRDQRRLQQQKISENIKLRKKVKALDRENDRLARDNQELRTTFKSTMR